MVDDAFRGFPGDDEQVSTVRVGDRVRVTCGESVVVGTVTNVRPYGVDGVDVLADGCTESNAFRFENWAFEVIAPPIPDVVGTIVRDRDNDAWQQNHHGWVSANTSHIYKLDALRSAYGPLTVVWTPEATS